MRFRYYQDKFFYARVSKFIFLRQNYRVDVQIRHVFFFSVRVSFTFSSPPVLPNVSIIYSDHLFGGPLSRLNKYFILLPERYISYVFFFLNTGVPAVYKPYLSSTKFTLIRYHVNRRTTFPFISKYIPRPPGRFQFLYFIFCS